MASRSRLAQIGSSCHSAWKTSDFALLREEKAGRIAALFLFSIITVALALQQPKLAGSSTNDQQKCPLLANLCRYLPTLRTFMPLNLPRYPNVIPSHQEGYGKAAHVDMDEMQREAAKQHWDAPLASHGLGLQLLKHNKDIKEWVQREQGEENLPRSVHS